MTSNESTPRDEVGPTFELQVPVDLVEPVATLLPGLVAKGARRLEVFDYARPGEPPYWLAFIVAGERRYSVGTPDLRHQELADQLADLVRQLACWGPSESDAAFE